ncbi:hypothetical protein BCR39DRAFT_530565 [Naematelia encephala]|uniref:SET domain-containing protein n=1 Tax=Naematelia encephala TaxID=71784 RepID=A0A1Y2B5P0_9TREE|nr:hypothetical protein BCR39DRAFT_530565 [Naematelia encephala]
MSKQQLPNAAILREWLEAHGGVFHPSVEFRNDPLTGLSPFASTELPSGETLVSCPFELAVTPEESTRAICDICGLDDSELQGWNERMRICGYLGLHLTRAASGVDLPSSLRHLPYINALPPCSELLTPLFYSPAELELLAGTNLYGAVHDREQELRAEYEQVQSKLRGDAPSWDQYLSCATYISSRAFPSKLLRIPDSGSVETRAVDTSEEEESHPVLLPGVDLFNHARGQPITWLSSPMNISNKQVKTISLVSCTIVKAGQQVFNNYGPKSNEELLLAYGFILDPNPDDTVILRLGTNGLPEGIVEKLKAKQLDATKRFALGADGLVPNELLQVMRVMLGGADEEVEIDEEDEHALHAQEQKETELELDVLGQLGAMLEDKLQRLKSHKGDSQVDGVREHVRKMCVVYREGERAPEFGA